MRAQRGPLLLLCGVLGFASGCLGRLTTEDRARFAERLSTRTKFERDPDPAHFSLPVPASDARIATIGRIEQVTIPARSDGKALLFSWPGSELRARFRGTAIAIEVASEGEVHFDVAIDDELYLLSLRDAGLHRHALAARGPGPHLLRVMKRTEAAAGVARIVSIAVAKAGELLPAPSLPVRRLEFIGDSMTVGACTYDDGAENWQQRETHDHGASYAARTATALQAQHRAIAVSGMGVSRGTVPLRAQEIFDRCRPDPKSPPAARDDWHPDAVIVFLGHNDVIAGRGFPARFFADYVRLVRSLRARYPHSLILCATGGMARSRNSAQLARAFDRALRELQTADVGIFAHRFSAWSFLHPRAHTHAKLAAELRPILSRLLGW